MSKAIVDNWARDQLVHTNRKVPVSGPLTDAELRAAPLDVSVASVVLPPNAAQETGGNLASILAALVLILGQLDVALSALASEATLSSLDGKDFATSAKQDTGNTSLASIDGKLTNPLPVSASSLPLPSDASTETTQLLVLAALGGSSTTLYSTIDDTRRLQEDALLESMQQVKQLGIIAEQYSGDRRGFELR